MAMISRASTTWVGDLTTGSGNTSTASGVVNRAPVSWGKRAEDRSAGTSPEELIAAAHSACFSMAFAARLAKNKTPAARLDVTVTVTFDKTEGGFRILSSAIDVTGEAAGIDPAEFRRIADDAKANCPVSKALEGNVDITLNAALR